MVGAREAVGDRSLVWIFGFYWKIRRHTWWSRQDAKQFKTSVCGHVHDTGLSCQIIKGSEVSGCLLRSVKGTFIGMSESRRGIINGAEGGTVR